MRGTSQVMIQSKSKEPRYTAANEGYKESYINFYVYPPVVQTYVYFLEQLSGEVHSHLGHFHLYVFSDVFEDKFSVKILFHIQCIGEGCHQYVLLCVF